MGRILIIPSKVKYRQNSYILFPCIIFIANSLKIKLFNLYRYKKIPRPKKLGYGAKVTKSPKSQARILPQYLDMYLSNHSAVGIPCVVNTHFTTMGGRKVNTRNQKPFVLFWSSGLGIPHHSSLPTKKREAFQCLRIPVLALLSLLPHSALLQL